MRGNRYHLLPDRCCMKCKYSKLISGGKLRCTYEDSYYFNSEVAKKDHCPDFKKGGKT